MKDGVVVPSLLDSKQLDARTFFSKSP